MLTYTISLLPSVAVHGLCWCWIMEPEPSPLDMIFAEIERGLEAGVHYLSIAVSLSLPDICARLEMDKNSRPRMPQYVEWCKEYLQNDAYMLFHRWGFLLSPVRRSASGGPDRAPRGTLQAHSVYAAGTRRQAISS
jgi:hypothetical protein